MTLARKLTILATWRPCLGCQTPLLFARLGDRFAQPVCLECAEAISGAVAS